MVGVRLVSSRQTRDVSRQLRCSIRLHGSQVPPIICTLLGGWLQSAKAPVTGWNVQAILSVGPS
jgi:hypothetical protein